jgi:hypothetical protein
MKRDCLRGQKCRQDVNKALGGITVASGQKRLIAYKNGVDSYRDNACSAGLAVAKGTNGPGPIWWPL